MKSCPHVSSIHPYACLSSRVALPTQPCLQLKSFRPNPDPPSRLEGGEKATTCNPRHFCLPKCRQRPPCDANASKSGHRQQCWYRSYTDTCTHYHCSSAAPIDHKGAFLADAGSSIDFKTLVATTPGFDASDSMPIRKQQGTWSTFRKILGSIERYMESDIYSNPKGMRLLTQEKQLLTPTQPPFKSIMIGVAKVSLAFLAPLGQRLWRYQLQISGKLHSRLAALHYQDL